MNDGINLDRAECYSNSAYGVYIPQHFAETINRDLLSGVSSDDLEILEFGPDHEFYWDAWADCIDNAILSHPVLGECRLWQDGDLWVYVVADQPE